MDERLALAGAKDDSYRGIFTGLRPVFTGVVQINSHLPGVGVGEAAELEIENDETAKSAVEEQQVDTEPLVVNSQAALSPDESEVVAEFKEERFKLADKRAALVDMARHLGMNTDVVQVKNTSDAEKTADQLKAEVIAMIADLGLAPLIPTGVANRPNGKDGTKH